MNRLRLGPLVIALLAVGVAVNSVFLWVALARITREGHERRDQICVAAERQHNELVDGVRRTYLYFQTMPESLARSGINRAILQQLPETEAKARIMPPDFCSGKVGLHDPAARVPPRPAHVTLLLQHLQKP